MEAAPSQSPTVGSPTPTLERVLSSPDCSEPPIHQHAALRTACLNVVGKWVNDRGDAIDLSEVHEVLRDLGATLERILDDPVTAIVPPPASLQSPLARRLLELVRGELLRVWERTSRPPDSEEMLRVLTTVERLREVTDPCATEIFVSRFAGPGGLELVVQVAHDLRSPLTSILFLAEILQRGQSGDVTAVQRRQLGLIYSAALGLNSMANDMIELARVGNRLVEDSPSPFSVKDVMESVQSLVAPLAEEKNLEIRLVPPQLDYRLGHPLALSRVLLNLTTNAMKFTDRGYVELSARDHDLTRMEFSVQDSGQGVNPSALASLYQPFRRATGRDGYAFSGTGLGLAICRKLVQTMGSELVLETEPGQGTRFSFTVQVPPAPDGRFIPPESSSATPSRSAGIPPLASL